VEVAVRYLQQPIVLTVQRKYKGRRLLQLNELSQFEKQSKQYEITAKRNFAFYETESR
jgi:hypothetical protein